MFQSEYDQIIVYGICHLFAMSSTCSNPILYAFLNKDFNKVSFTIHKKDFKKQTGTIINLYLNFLQGLMFLRTWIWRWSG